MYELTHVYQQEPQGIGSYGTNREFRAFIEGMATSMQVIFLCGCGIIKTLNFYAN